MELKKKITPKPAKKTSPAVLNVSTNAVELKTPAVKIEAPQMQIESTIVDALASAVRQLAVQQAQILKAVEEQTKAIQALANSKQDIKVEAPKVNMPSRPSRFYVSLNKENGETVGMQIESSH